jgi:phage N-6-adenine-methyltransferase
MNTAVHFSSQTDLWSTPQYLFDELDTEFHFTTDVCANASNAKCKHFYSVEEDGLKQTWSGICWMNPPYGKTIGEWVKKAYESSLSGATVVCLLPARTDTRWWHDYCMKGEIRFIKGRLKFGTATNSAPFPSAIVIFKSAKKPIIPSSQTINTGTGHP